MKVTIENKKGLSKDLKVIIDKKTMDSYLNDKYEEIKKNFTLKGFRPGKAPREIIKRQFGDAIMGEVLDKVLKDTSTKALEENKIRPALQPKIDLKTYGEGKQLEYIIKVTELPQIDTKQLSNIKFEPLFPEIIDKFFGISPPQTLLTIDSTLSYQSSSHLSFILTLIPGFFIAKSAT